MSKLTSLCFISGKALTAGDHCFLLPIKLDPTRGHWVPEFSPLAVTLDGDLNPIPNETPSNAIRLLTLNFMVASQAKTQAHPESRLARTLNSLPAPIAARLTNIDVAFSISPRETALDGYATGVSIWPLVLEEISSGRLLRPLDPNDEDSVEFPMDVAIVSADAYLTLVDSIHFKSMENSSTRFGLMFEVLNKAKAKQEELEYNFDNEIMNTEVEMGDELAWACEQLIEGIFTSPIDDLELNEAWELYEYGDYDERAMAQALIPIIDFKLFQLALNRTGRHLTPMQMMPLAQAHAAEAVLNRVSRTVSGK